MNSQIQTIAELDRLIHEPGRLMILTLLYAVDQADFLYLQHETGINKGTLPATSPNSKTLATSRS